MYGPIKKLLESVGFTVKGEVKGCDIAAMRGDELWLVEMKLSMTITLLYQAMSRQSISPCVFAAIPRPKKFDKKFMNAQRILKKLELGLIIVALDSEIPFAEIILHPGKPHKAYKRSASVRSEIENRVGDTPGGSTKVPITTVYREQCIKVACMADRHGGEFSPKILREEYNCGKNTGMILHRNFYGWFKKVKKGLYILSDEGRDFLNNSADNPVVREYRKNKTPDAD